MLGHDVVSNHSTPDIGSRCPWTPKHLSNLSVLPHLYTMPDSRTYACTFQQSQADQQMRGQPLITSTKVLDVTPESGSSTRSR